MGQARALSWIAHSVVLLLVGVSLGAEPLSIQTAPVLLDLREPAQRTGGRLRYVGGLHLTSDHPRFGGWSSLRLGADGTRLTAISRGDVDDRANCPPPGGFLTGLKPRIGPLLDLTGKPSRGRTAGIRSRARSCPTARSSWASSASTASGATRPTRGGPTRSRARYGAHPGSRKPPSAAASNPWSPSLGAASSPSPSTGSRTSSSLAGSRAPTLGNPRLPVRAGAPPLGRLPDAVGGSRGPRARQQPRSGNRGRAAPPDLEGRAQARRGPGRPAHRRHRPRVDLDNFEGVDCRRGRHGAPILYLIADDNFNQAQRTLLLMYELNGP